MENPFDLIMERLNSIERLLVDIQRNRNSEIKGAIFTNEILTVEQAAKFLNISRMTVYKHTSDRNLPHYKTGKRLYFKRGELEEWLTKNRIKTREDIENEANEYILKRRWKRK